MLLILKNRKCRSVSFVPYLASENTTSALILSSGPDPGQSVSFSGLYHMLVVLSSLVLGISSFNRKQQRDEFRSFKSQGGK